MARASSSYEVDAPGCDAVNNMEPLNPSDAMMMPACHAELGENLDPGAGSKVELAPHRAIRERSWKRQLTWKIHEELAGADQAVEIV